MVEGVGFGSGHSLGLVELLDFLLDGLENIHIFFHLLGLLRGFIHIKFIDWRGIFLFKRRSREIFFNFYWLRGWRPLENFNCETTWHCWRFWRNCWFWRLISLHFETWSNSLNRSIVIFRLWWTLFIITVITLNWLMLNSGEKTHLRMTELFIVGCWISNSFIMI